MIRVACAVIFNDSRVLAVKRGPQMPLANQWEFPGGKVKHSETDEDCIIREIREELSIHIKPLHKLTPVVHHYPDKSIELIPIVCEIAEGEIVLTEHSEMRWLGKDELNEVEWCEADIPIVSEVKNVFIEW